eukprot:1189872-Prorocentrum_minimum.AAC.3
MTVETVSPVGHLRYQVISAVAWSCPAFSSPSVRCYTTVTSRRVGTAPSSCTSSCEYTPKLV